MSVTTHGLVGGVPACLSVWVCIFLSVAGVYLPVLGVCLSGVRVPVWVCACRSVRVCLLGVCICLSVRGVCVCVPVCLVFQLVGFSLKCFRTFILIIQWLVFQDQPWPNIQQLTGNCMWQEFHWYFLNYHAWTFHLSSLITHLGSLTPYLRVVVFTSAEVKSLCEILAFEPQNPVMSRCSGWLWNLLGRHNGLNWF